MVQSLKGGAALGSGVNHPNYAHKTAPVPDSLRAALLADLA